MAKLRKVTNVFEGTELGEEFVFLGSIADLVESEMPEGKWEVWVNGVLVVEEEWSSITPSDTDIILIKPCIAGGGGGDDKAPARMALMIGVSIVSMGVGAAIQGSFGLAAGATMSFGQTGLVVAGMTATNIIGGMLVNKLLPFPETEEAPDHSVYSLNPLATQQQGLPLPMWYGEFKLRSGNIISGSKNLDVVSPTVSAETYDFIMSYGIGPWESIDNIIFPNALNAKKLIYEHRLGTLDQADFGSTYDYSKTSHETALTIFNADTPATMVHSSSLTTTIAQAGLDKVEFDLYFPAGGYVVYQNTKGPKYTAITMQLELLVADSASFNGSDYAWEPLACTIDGGSNNYAENTTTELSRVTSRWSYGVWITFTLVEMVTTGDYEVGYITSEQTSIINRWLEYDSNLVNTPHDIPALTSDSITEFKWRYISTTEVIELAGPSTVLKSSTQVGLRSPFELRYSAQLNALKPVTSYVFKFNFTRKSVYDVPGSDNLSTGHEQVIGACSINYLDAYSDKTTVLPLKHPRNVLLRVMGTAENNVESFIPEVSFKGRKVWVYNGSQWDFIWSNNPAWVCYDVLTQPVVLDSYYINGTTPTADPSPYIVRYEGLNASKLDTTSFLQWADFCDELVAAGESTEKRYTFNGGFDSIVTLWEAALAIAGGSQAWLVWHGSEIQVVLDKETATTQLFTTGNYITDSVKENYLSFTDRATAIEIEFIDKGNDYKSNKFALTDSGYADSQKKVAIQARGCTSASQAYRVAKFDLLKNKHLNKITEFQAPLNGIACTIGDVIEFQSSVGKFNNGGRVKAISSPTVLTLDRSYTFELAKTYELRTVNTAGVLTTRTLIPLNGTTDTITLTASSTIAAGDVYTVGESLLVVEKLRVMDVSQTTELTCTLSCVQYIPEIYDYNDSDIVNIVHTPVADMPAVAIESIVGISYFDLGRDQVFQISIDITKPDSVYYKSAKVYYKREDMSSWSFAGVMADTSFSFNVPTGNYSYTIAVATVNTADITMNILDAPTGVVTPSFPILSSVTSFAVTSQYLGVVLSWVHPNPNSVASYQIWQASTNDRSLATLAYTGVENNTTLQLPTIGIFYFWIRAVDSLGSFGAWAPEGELGGIPGSGDALTVGQFYEFGATAPNPTFVSQLVLS